MDALKELVKIVNRKRLSKIDVFDKTFLNQNNSNLLDEFPEVHENWGEKKALHSVVDHNLQYVANIHCSDNL